MQRRTENQQYLVDLEASDASQSTGYRHLDNKEIDELYASYNLMKNFSETISHQNSNALSQILEKYAERPIKFELVPKNVMHILDKRIQRMLKNKRLKKNWSSQDAEILCWTFSHYCQLNGINSVEEATIEDWQNISKLIPGSSPDSCMFKILSLKKIKLAKQKWTEYQSRLLLQIAMNIQKKNWRVIAQQLYKKNENPSKIFRNAKQCKQHWVCYLNPDLKKGSWSLDQDKKLMQYVYTNNGSRKWAQIARIFGGRTQNALKNRYTLIIERLRREKNFVGSNKDLDFIKQYIEKLQGIEEIQSQRKTIRQRRKQESSLAKTIEENIIISSENAKQEQKVQQTAQQTPIMTNKGMFSMFSYPTSIQLTPYMSLSNENLYSMAMPYIPSSSNQIYFICPASYSNINLQ